MKKIFIILFLVCASVFSYGQISYDITESFCEEFNVICDADADYDFLTNTMIITKKETIEDDFNVILMYDSYTKKFSYIIGGHKFEIDCAKVTKTIYNNDVVDYTITHEVIKESNNHRFYIPWIFKFRFTKDKKMMLIKVHYINLKEYTETK